jgi:hypothetical protein
MWTQRLNLDTLLKITEELTPRIPKGVEGHLRKEEEAMQPKKSIYETWHRIVEHSSYLKVAFAWESIIRVVSSGVVDKREVGNRSYILGGTLEGQPSSRSTMALSRCPVEKVNDSANRAASPSDPH